MVPIITDEFVDKRKWMSNEDMLDTIALMQSLPGIIAVNMSTLVGYRIAGLPGVLASVLGVVLPPFCCIVAIAWLLFNFMDNSVVEHIFTGVRAGVCAMILVAVIKLGKKTLTGAFEITLAAIGFIALLVFNVNVIIMILAAAVAGLVMTGCCMARARKAANMKEKKS